MGGQSLKGDQVRLDTRPKNKLLAFLFVNFEMTRGSTGMANVNEPHNPPVLPWVLK